jgi:hypothetical protein
VLAIRVGTDPTSAISSWLRRAAMAKKAKKAAKKRKAKKKKK